MKQCPYCYAGIDDDSRFCAVCGKDLSKCKSCIRCGTVTDENAAWCSECGAPLEGNPQFVVFQEQERERIAKEEQQRREQELARIKYAEEQKVKLAEEQERQRREQELQRLKKEKEEKERLELQKQKDEDSYQCAMNMFKAQQFEEALGLITPIAQRTSMPEYMQLKSEVEKAYVIQLNGQIGELLQKKQYKDASALIKKALKITPEDKDLISSREIIKVQKKRKCKRILWIVIAILILLLGLVIAYQLKSTEEMLPIEIAAPVLPTNTEIKQDVSVSDESQSNLTYADLEDIAKKVFSAIPDHSKVSSLGMNQLSNDLYISLRDAWEAIPTDAEEIGDEEFLFYFLTGNGGDEVDYSSVKLLSVNLKTDTRCCIKVEYCTRWEDGEMAQEKVMTMILIVEDGKWVLDDFDGVKEMCKNYIDMNEEVVEEVAEEVAD